MDMAAAPRKSSDAAGRREAESAGDDGEEEGPAVAVETAPKKRGRPKKVPEDGEAPKKRGRPKKNPDANGAAAPPAPTSPSRAGAPPVAATIYARVRRVRAAGRSARAPGRSAPARPARPPRARTTPDPPLAYRRSSRPDHAPDPAVPAQPPRVEKRGKKVGPWLQKWIAEDPTASMERYNELKLKGKEGQAVINKLRKEWTPKCGGAGSPKAPGGSRGGDGDAGPGTADPTSILHLAGARASQDGELDRGIAAKDAKRTSLEDGVVESRYAVSDLETQLKRAKILLKDKEKELERVRSAKKEDEARKASLERRPADEPLPGVYYDVTAAAAVDGKIGEVAARADGPVYVGLAKGLAAAQKRYACHKGQAAEKREPPTMLLLHELAGAEDAARLEAAVNAGLEARKPNAVWEKDADDGYGANGAADAAAAGGHFLYVLYRPRV